MPLAKDVYIHCDVLESLPVENRENWLHELSFLERNLRQQSSALQVGCMDGTRILRLLERRPDLHLTGLDIDASLLEIAKENFKKVGKKVQTVHADITDATLPTRLNTFDAVLCLNNTLGYIADVNAAIANMKELGKTVYLSVYGEAFTDAIARAYFTQLGLAMEKIDGDHFLLRDFGDVRRFMKEDVEKWDGTIEETPLGYMVTIHT
ncbi:MAG: class I SAM-dependent methyltransferase [Candidatus Peregrinibacteria bacterium]|nr:class I SAM-dependent methyltransferase [Candidatus Peregrinibacteria bacterium]